MVGKCFGHLLVEDWVRLFGLINEKGKLNVAFVGGILYIKVLLELGKGAQRQIYRMTLMNNGEFMGFIRELVATS